MLKMVKAGSVEESKKSTKNNPELFAVVGGYHKYLIYPWKEGEDDYGFFDFIMDHGYDSDSGFNLYLQVGDFTGILLVPQQYTDIYKHNIIYMVDIEGIEREVLMPASDSSDYSKFAEKIKKINPFINQPFLSIDGDKIYMHGSEDYLATKPIYTFTSAKITGDSLDDKIEVIDRVLSGRHEEIKIPSQDRQAFNLIINFNRDYDYSPLAIRYDHKIVRIKS